MKKEERFQDKRIVVLVALFCMFLWGSAIPVTKSVYQVLDLKQEEQYTKIFFAGIRFFLSSVLVFIYLMINRDKKEYKLKTLEKKDWGFLGLVGLLRITLCYYFYYISIGYLSGVKGSILTSSGTFFTVLLAPFIVKEDRFTLQKFIALVLGFSGIIVANYSGGFNLDFTLYGEGYMLLSGLVTAMSEVIIKPMGKNVSAPIITWGQLFFGSIPLLVIGAIGLEHPLNWTPLALILLLYSVFISAVAFILWYELLKVNDAGKMSIYRLFIPIFGSITSAIFLPNESFTIALFLGLALVVLGIIVLNKSPGKKESKTA